MDFLRLKWGTVKSFDFTNSPEAFEAYNKYVELGACVSVMLQEDTPEQKQLILEMIDKVNGQIIIDWTGEDCTNDREKAKQYVLEYKKN